MNSSRFMTAEKAVRGDFSQPKLAAKFLVDDSPNQLKVVRS
jgi:hypothetical protein